MNPEQSKLAWPLVLDKYTLQARVVPAIIIASPILPLAVVALSVLNLSSKTIGSTAILFFAAIFAASQAVRVAGEAIEQKLWRSWGGAPSTRFVRWRDAKFAPETKERIHWIIRNRFGIALLAFEAEAGDQSLADSRIEQAFLQVRQVLRNEAAKDLVNTHNAEYGFVRNLVGTRSVFVVVAVGCVVASMLGYYFHPGPRTLGLCGLETFLLALSIWFGWFVFPRLLQPAADAYAESAWSSFLNLPSNMKYTKKPRSS